VAREDIRSLVERSSFGEDEARRARSRVSEEDARAVFAKISAKKSTPGRGMRRR
jgi:hypothetical protein